MATGCRVDRRPAVAGVVRRPDDDRRRGFRRPEPRRRVRDKRIPDRQVLCGILFGLHTGIQWEFLSQELGFGSGMTCWRRLEGWNRAGVWQRLHELLVAELQDGRQADWSRAVIGSCMCGGQTWAQKRLEPVRPRPPGLEAPGPDRGRRHPPGRRVDRRQPPRRHPTASADRQDSAGPGLARPTPPAPRPALRPPRAYDHDKCRRAVRGKGIRPRIARRGHPHGSGLGAFRWVVERAIA